MATSRSRPRTSGETITSDAAPPAPRFAFGWASLVYALATLTLAYPALAGKFLVNPHSDQYIAGYAFREFAASTLRSAGHFPLWNPYLFGGMPYVAAMHGDIFYPTFLLRMVLPTDVAMTWGFIIHLFLAGLFTFGFLRAIGYGFAGSLIGGLAYLMGGQIASYVSPGHDGKLFVSALFPLALWVLHRGVRDGARWCWGALALIVGLAVLSPHPQLLQYMLLASGAYALFIAFAELNGARLVRAIAVKRLALALGAVIVGLAIGAIQYLPVREYVAWSPRAGGMSSYEHATSYAWPPAELFNTYLPQFSGMLNAYWGENGIHYHSDYMGAAVLVLAGAAYFGLRADPRRKQVIFWTAALLVSLLWAMGGHTPFYRIPYAIVPGTKFFRAPATIFFVGALALALLACAGAERLLALRVPRRYFIGWMAAALAVAVLATVGGLTGIASTLADPRLADRVDANNGALVLGAWRSFLFVALTGASALLLARGKLPARIAVFALVGVMAIDLWTIMRSYWMFSEPASRVYASDEIIETIKAEAQPARVLAFPLVNPPAPDPFLTGDALMSHKIRNVMGYHGNQLGRFNTLMGKDQDYNQLFNPNFLQLTNTKFLLTNNHELPFVANITPVKGPVRNAAGDQTWLYKLTASNPYAWVTPVSVKAPDAEVLATVLDPRFDVRRAALFDPSADIEAAPSVQALPEPLAIAANVTSYEPGRVSLELTAAAPAGSALVVSENYYPGWTATVDGKTARAGRVDYTLIGVELPAGARKVELAFRSAPYERGKAITLFALAIGAVALGAGLWLDRRAIA
ncbi:MAG TPA: YfhO family protein [Gemmatimonadaceae bacterium]|nr:YfhO family protein [Gemmatimonadaceae bacterium]